LYDSGAAVPKRPAKSTFFSQNGKTYPAKFIRGLAYRLATGVELDPSRDYSGGLETVKFFESLGLSTRDEPPSDPEEPTAVSTPALSVEAPLRAPREHREPQKRALSELLRQRFGLVETEAEFPWLTVPAPGDMDETIATIFHALKAMRGFSEFITPAKPLRCDFFVPGERLVVEYDERQHFTRQRATALELYPAELHLGFDREQWIVTCRTIQATDPTPPHRDEQRAFYDSLRDILAARNGVRLIRLRFGTADWTASDAGERLNAILGLRSLVSTSSTVPTVTTPSGTTAQGVNRVALVSHDYNVADISGRYDYSEYFARINVRCDKQGCDTILYALYTWDKESPVPRDHGTLFQGLSHVQRIILEVGSPPETFDHVEVWQRGSETPLVAKQRFATSSAPACDKQAFLEELTRRQVQNTVLVICGETNISSLVRGSNRFSDPYHFTERLGELKVQIIFNPVHDYMRRYEMREKRRYYSSGGRTVISVWNQGKGKESHLPWTVFHNGVERTKDVVELARPVSERTDIRVGILDLSAF
jgi:hypothetical protein